MIFFLAGVLFGYGVSEVRGIRRDTQRARAERQRAIDDAQASAWPEEWASRWYQ